MSDRSTEDGERRHGENRETITLRAELRQGSHLRVPTRLLDLSPTGFRIRHTARLQLERSLFIKVGGLGSLEAFIRWHRDGEYGCEFAQPLHVAVFEHLVRLSRAEDPAA